MEDLFSQMSILTAISAVLGLIIGASGVGMKVREIIIKVRKAVDYYKSAIHPDSDGGEELTDAEKERIAEKTVNIIETAIEQYGDTLVGKLLGLKQK